MAHELITEWNMSEGFQVLFLYGNDVTGGILMRLVMFAIFVIISGGLYGSQKKAVGRGDFPQGAVVAGFVTSVLAIILRLLSSALVDNWTLSTILIVTLLCFVWFLFSKD